MGMSIKDHLLLEIRTGYAYSIFRDCSIKELIKRQRKNTLLLPFSTSNEDYCSLFFDENLNQIKPIDSKTEWKLKMDACLGIAMGICMELQRFPTFIIRFLTFVFVPYFDKNYKIWLNEDYPEFMEALV